MNDSISRQTAIDMLKTVASCVDEDTQMFVDTLIRFINDLPSAQSEIEKKIKDIGYTGKEGKIYIGGRLFAVRELAQ